MRISDWSSDVCSSDLDLRPPGAERGAAGAVAAVVEDHARPRQDLVHRLRLAVHGEAGPLQRLGDRVGHVAGEDLAAHRAGAQALQEGPRLLVLQAHVSDEVRLALMRRQRLIQPLARAEARKSGVSGQSVSVRVALGGGRLIQQNNYYN